MPTNIHKIRGGKCPQKQEFYKTRVLRQEGRFKLPSIIEKRYGGSEFSPLMSKERNTLLGIYTIKFYADICSCLIQALQRSIQNYPNCVQNIAVANPHNDVITHNYV